jgi:isoleucyl-tRNA synthetase
LIVSEINNFSPEDIAKIEREGNIDVEINKKLVNLSLEEVEITSQDIEGWLVASSGGLTVALDVSISPELKKEGVARELVNRIQNLRKDSGYELTDTIDVTLQKDGIIEDAVNDNITYIKNETLTATLDFAEVVDEGAAVEFDDVTTKVFIKKH